MKSITDFITEDRDPILYIRQSIFQLMTEVDQKVTKSKEFKDMLKEVWGELCKRYDIK